MSELKLDFLKDKNLRICMLKIFNNTNKKLKMINEMGNIRSNLKHNSDKSKEWEYCFQILQYKTSDTDPNCPLHYKVVPSKRATPAMKARKKKKRDRDRQLYLQRHKQIKGFRPVLRKGSVA